MFNRTLLAIGITLMLFALGYTIVQAQEPDDQESAESQPSNAYCLLCHEQPDQVWQLPSGETVSVTIDAATLDQSVHGMANPDGTLNCIDCHDQQTFPHQAPEARTLREFKLERYGACRTCHEDEYLHAQDSVHGAALRNGQIEAAVCVDCHGSHDIQPPDQPRERISFTCGQCHGAIFETYAGSVHGMALLEEANPDVPTCIDCHGVHNIQDPRTAAFRIRSPELCANCHADTEKMSKYDISTEVFESYLADFHGSTVALFESEDEEEATNKAVCFDCHGVHNIARVDNVQNIRENLVETCRQCHPDAGTNFSDAWIGHYPAKLETNPILATASTFYDFLLPAAGGLIGFFIILDLLRRVLGR